MSEEEAEGEESGSDSRVSRPRDLSYVFQAGSTQFAYEVGVLTVGEPSSRKSVAIIFISSHEGGGVVAALPQRAWDKRAGKRKIPKGPFVKPVLIEVAAADFKDRERPGNTFLKVWVGVLSQAVADTVVFDSAADACDIVFLGPEGQPAFPYASALVQAADGQFGFVSAQSGRDLVETRLQAIEASLAKLTSFLGPGSEDRAGQKNAQAKATLGAKARQEGSVPGTPKPAGAARDLSGLDPAVVRSALDSGIGRKELAEIHDLVQNRRPRLTDYGGGRAAEEGGALGSAGGDSPRSLIAGSEKSRNDVGEAGGSVETAVVALTKIVAELAKGKRGNSDKSGGLEAPPAPVTLQVVHPAADREQPPFVCSRML